MATTAALTENSRQGFDLEKPGGIWLEAELSQKPRWGCGHVYDETPVDLAVYVRNDPVNLVDTDGREWQVSIEWGEAGFRILFSWVPSNPSLSASILPFTPYFTFPSRPSPSGGSGQASHQVSLDCRSNYGDFLTWLQGDGAAAWQNSSPDKRQEFETSVAAFRAAMNDIANITIYDGLWGKFNVALSGDPNAVAATTRLAPSSIYVDLDKVREKSGDLTTLDTIIVHEITHLGIYRTNPTIPDGKDSEDYEYLVQAQYDLWRNRVGRSRCTP